MADPENESRPSKGKSATRSDGLSPTDLMTEQLEASISPNVKRRIDAMVAEVNKFNDLEKLLLYLKLPTGVSGFDSNRLKSSSPSLAVTRIEQTQAFNWIRSHLEECSDTSLPKHEVYEDYRLHCDSATRRVLSPADFGKIMKSVFPQVKQRRLGTRGNAKYCYSGLRKKSEIQPPLLPSMESPRKIGPNDIPHSSSSCKCSQEQQQADLANTIVICEWAEKIFATHFQTTDEIAHHLASNKLVSSSMASFTVLSSGKDSLSSSSRSLRSDFAVAKLPITPEERRKETQHQLQKKIQQRQLHKMKEEQLRQANERLPALKPGDPIKGAKQRDDRKVLNRSHSMPDEMQMNARTDSHRGENKELDKAPNGSQFGNQQVDHNASLAHQSGLQTNNNSNNNSNQLPVSSSVTTTVTTVKESPNNKRRFTPIQPKTPVRDGAVKMPLNVNNLPNGPMVFFQPNGTILNSKGQKLPPGVQFIQISSLSNGSMPQMATIPIQNIPNPKLVASGTAKSSVSSPGTSRAQNVIAVPVSPGQVLKGSPVAGGVLVVKQSPQAGLAANFVNGSLQGNKVSVGQKDPTTTLPSHSNTHMLQLQSDAGGASPQGGCSATHSGIIPSLTSTSLLSSKQDVLTSPPVQPNSTPACSYTANTSTVLLRSAHVEPQKTSPQADNHPSSAMNQVAVNKLNEVNPVAVGIPTASVSHHPSTAVTFSTFPFQKQTMTARDGMSMAGNHDLNVLSSQGGLTCGLAASDHKQIPANSASALLAILSNTANKEQGLEESRGASKVARANPQIGGSNHNLQPAIISMTGTSSISQLAQQNMGGLVSTAYKASQDAHLKSNMMSSASLKNVPAVPVQLTRAQKDLPPASNSGLISILTAPSLETSHVSNLHPANQQVKEGHQQISSSYQSIPVYSLPINTANQPLDLAAHRIQLPIAMELGNKRLALSPVHVDQSSSAVSLQHRTLLPQINEVGCNAMEDVNTSILIKQEMENLGSQLVQQGIPVTQPISFVNGIAQGTAVIGIQQPAGMECQGRQSTTSSLNPHSNTATPIPLGIESVPQSPNDPNQVYFTFTPIQQSTEQVGVSVTSPSPVKPMQKPKPKFGTSQVSFVAPNRKRRTSGSTRRPNTNGTINCLPPAVSRQITPTPSPSGSRCSTPLSPSLVSAISQADAASMPPPSPVTVLSDPSQSMSNRASTKRDLSSQSQTPWGTQVISNRKRNPSGPATLMQPTKQLSLDAATFLPEEITDLNIRSYNPNLELNTSQHYQRSHSVPLPAYQPVVLSQDRFISNFPASVEQRGVTVNNRSFGAKRNLTQELQEIQVTDEDFNPEEHFLEGSDTAFNDLLNADLQQPTQGQGSWVSNMQPECSTELAVDFPMTSCSSERDTENELDLAQGLGDNSNSTTSTLNEEIAAMDDMGSNPVFHDFTLPSWPQMGSSGNLASLECSM
ncbi:DNA-binding protein RFX7-like [Patiria miniata]|uniref:RFX-type winged-helix domain-containing protein n=1 Tax=Patiria miniata TaxID=46514 RepID=A0A913Z2Z6_PATMI|nr:DNA-binding protein RFX7-like [Patiria miniata]